MTSEMLFGRLRTAEADDDVEATGCDFKRSGISRDFPTKDIIVKNIYRSVLNKFNETTF